MLSVLLALLALIFFGLATFSIPSHPRFQWVPAGWFCLALIYVLHIFPHTA